MLIFYSYMRVYTVFTYKDCDLYSFFLPVRYLLDKKISSYLLIKKRFFHVSSVFSENKRKFLFSACCRKMK